ncbi:MAG: SDR family NAD(P)-dependent oxidoreductase [Oscillospiraceae bacterium]|nr:SDR family NAD(P)-dependent oxidoreductase [Oscillospiraceae bacterium]
MKRIAIVTGASSGMGKEFVFLLDKKNLDEIWVVARRADRLEALRQEVKTPLRVIPADLISKEDLARVTAMMDEEQPDIRYLVNGAGFGKFGHFEDFEHEQVERMIDLNVKAAVEMTYRAIPHMNEGGRIIEIVSCSAFQPLPYMNIYASTKAFMLHFSRALHRELKSRKISVTAVCPGWVDTEFFSVAKDTSNPGAVSHHPFMQSPAKVAALALRHADKGKDLSVYGLNVKAQRMAAKIFPMRFIIWVWTKTR